MLTLEIRMKDLNIHFTNEEVDLIVSLDPEIHLRLDDEETAHDFIRLLWDLCEEDHVTEDNRRNISTIINRIAIAWFDAQQRLL